MSVRVFWKRLTFQSGERGKQTASPKVGGSHPIQGLIKTKLWLRENWFSPFPEERLRLLQPADLGLEGTPSALTVFRLLDCRFRAFSVSKVTSSEEHSQLISIVPTTPQSRSAYPASSSTLGTKQTLKKSLLNPLYCLLSLHANYECAKSVFMWAG